MALTTLTKIGKGITSLFKAKGATHARELEDRFSDIINVKDYGVIGDGVVDDTEAIQAAIDSTPTGGRLIIGWGLVYKIRKVSISKAIYISAYGASFKLVGDNAGFHINGHSSNIRVKGGRFIGDGIRRDDDSTKAQVGILVSNGSGDKVSDVLLEDVYVQDTNVGIKVSYGENPLEPTSKVTLLNCEAKGMIGSVGGVGYGFQFAQAPNSSVIGGVVSNCGRHGVYFSEGLQYTMTSVEVTGCGIGDGSIRGAVNIARSTQVAMTNCNIHDNVDVGLLIDKDSQGQSPNAVQYISVNGCTFKNNRFGEVAVGSLNAPVDGIPFNINISGCSINAHPESTTPTLRIMSGNLVSIQSNTISVTNATTRVFDIIHQGNEYLDNLFIKDNLITGGLHAFQLPASLCTGTSVVNILGNISTLIHEYLFVGISESSISNPNLVYKRTGGKCVRVIDTSTTNLVVSGVDSLVMRQPNPSSITSCVGGREGQVLTFYFENGNTTLPNTPFYSPSGSITGDQYDSATFIFINNGWRLISFSQNV